MKFLEKYYWILLPLLAWIVVRFGFNFNGLYGQDAYAYLLHTREWKAFFLGGDQPGTFFWPPNYSIVSALLALVVKTEFYSLQLISVFSMVGLAGVLNAWFKQAFKQASALIRVSFVSLAFLFSPYLFRLGMQSMSDMLAMFLLTASFYYLWKFQNDRETKHMLLWAGVSGLALTTRYPAIIVLLPSMIFVAYTLVVNKQIKQLMLGLTAGLIPVAFAAIWKLSSGGVADAIQSVILNDWSVQNFFKTEFQRPDTNSSFLLPNILFNLSVFVHPGTLIYGIILLPLTFKNFRKDAFQSLLLVSILIYVIFLSGIPFQNSRVLVFAYPLVVMLVAPAYAQAIAWLESKNLPVKLVFAFCAMLQMGLCARAMQPSVEHGLFERELASWVSQNAAGKTIYTSWFSQIFEAYETGNPVIHIFNSEVKEFEPNSIIIFNEAWADFKLKETAPLRNWNRAKQTMRVEEQKCWPNGWCVYTVVSK